VDSEGTVLLGHGGFGESWLATDRLHQRRLVVKLLYVKQEDHKASEHLTWKLARPLTQGDNDMESLMWV